VLEEGVQLLDTPALRIDHLMRPFTEGQLRELIQRTGCIKGMWMPNIKVRGRGETEVLYKLLDIKVRGYVRVGREGGKGSRYLMTAAVHMKLSAASVVHAFVC